MKIVQRAIRAYLVVAVAVALSGCIATPSAVMSAVSPTEWSDAVTLTLRNEDSVSMRRISIVLRYNDNFRCDSLPLEVSVMSPDVRRYVEQVVLYPQFPRSASPVSTTEVIDYRLHSTLGNGGYYLFTLKPLRPVRGVEAVGINIENE